MNTFTKIALIPALTFAAMAPLAAHAGQGSHRAADDIVVTSQGEMQQWQEGATRRLNRALSRNPVERSAALGSGIVQVTFALDADGRPTDIALENSTAGRAAERSAIYAVRRMGDLSDVPVENAGGAQFIANIVFANDRAERRELTQQLARTERSRLASGSAAQTYIVLGG